MMNRKEIKKTILNGQIHQTSLTCELNDSGGIISITIQTLDNIDHGLNVYIENRMGRVDSLLSLFKDLINTLEDGQS